MHERALPIEETEADVADGAAPREIAQFLVGEGIAGIGERQRRLKRADADERHCQAAKLLHSCRT